MSDTYLKWNPATLGIGVKHMDDEHQVLISIMTRLHTRSDEGAGKAELTRIMQELLAYTRKHFSDEENYLQSIQYPKYGVHKNIHDQLLAKLADHVKAFEAGNGKVGEEFFRFLKVWLTAHIQGIDRQYGEFSRTVAA